MRGESTVIPVIPSTEEIAKLVRGVPGLRVSLYLPLAERPGFDDIRAVPTAYEQARKGALRRMAELGVDPAKAEGTSKQLESVDVELAGLPRGTRGIAVFAGPDGLQAFALAAPTRPSVTVGRSFHIRPLLRARGAERRFRVVALSTNRVQLYEGDAHGLRLLEAEGVPHSLQDALGSELTEASLQSRSSTSSGGAPIFHGHGGRDESRPVDLERFHRVLAAALERVWNGRDDPLVLAGDQVHQGRFHKIADLPGLLPQGVAGNPERLSPDELHARALPLVEQRYAEHEAGEAERAEAALAHGIALDDLEAAVAAATAGRVARAWIDAERHVARHVDTTTGRLVESFGDEDALEELAALVLRRGGSVQVRPDGLGSPSGVLAELRG